MESADRVLNVRGASIERRARHAPRGARGENARVHWHFAGNAAQLCEMRAAMSPFA
jgi:hypothetical protein